VSTYLRVNRDAASNTSIVARSVQVPVPPVPPSVPEQVPTFQNYASMARSVPILPVPSSVPIHVPVPIRKIINPYLKKTPRAVLSDVSKVDSEINTANSGRSFPTQAARVLPKWTPPPSNPVPSATLIAVRIYHVSSLMCNPYVIKECFRMSISTVVPRM
jgi:hypothetical protein